MKKNVKILIGILCLIIVGFVIFIMVNKVKIKTGEIDVFKVSNNSDQTRKINFKYKSPNTKGIITIPVDIHECTKDIKYKIVIDINDICNSSSGLDSIYFDELDTINGCVMKKGEIDIDSVEDKIINIDFKWHSAMVTDVGTNSYNKEIDVRIITSPLNEDENQNACINKLSDVVNVGDYVNYDANSNGEQTYTYNGNTYTTNVNKSWRVFSVDKETGEILITTCITGAQDFKGENGCEDIINQLNGISAIYGKGKYADWGRSINIEDIENNTTYDKKNYEKNEKDYAGNEYTSKYGDEYTVHSIWYKDETSGVSRTTTYTAKQTCYRYSITDYAKDSRFEDALYNRALIATPCVDVDPVNKYAAYGMFIINRIDNKCQLSSTGEIRSGGYKDNAEYYDENWSDIDGKYMAECFGRVVPIVKLNENVCTKGKDEIGVWQLCN